MTNYIQRINPDGLHKNPAFSQAVTTSGPGKTIYIGGQNAVNAGGEIIGKGDLSAQTVQAMQNMQTALAACGAGWKDVVQLTIYIVQGQNILEGFQASQQFTELFANPPAISGLFVAGLANPDFLVEISAIAFIPQ